MAYTPQFTDLEAAVMRRIAWGMGIPMTKALSVIIEITIQCCDGRLICRSCRDKSFCDECPFKGKERLRTTDDDTCPHCGQEIDDLYEYFSDQSDPKLDCPHCHQAIHGREVITYELSQAGGDDGSA